MPKRQRKEFYEVSKEEAKYMNSKNINNNNNNNTTTNNNTNSDQFLLERDHIASETFNYEYLIDSDTCDAYGNELINGSHSDVRIRNGEIANFAYENLKFDLNLSKQLLLHKFFRSAENTHYADYENLCKGCGYGVFEAHGNLCHFCQCLVNGVRTTTTTTTTTTINHVEDTSTTNIYENICDTCSRIYSSAECVCCNERKAIATASHSTLASSDRINNTIVQVNSGAADELKKSSAKVKKSKSFGKRDKRGIFQGIIGSLRRGVKQKGDSTSHTPSDTLSPRTRKRLEIVHNVDGYENIFRTQETFDLKRICELKRSQTSCSDQHIYGRLKRTNTPETIFATPQLSQSHDHLQQVNEENSNEEPHQIKAGSKAKRRPRISVPRLLLHSRSQSANDCNSNASDNTNPVKQALYLPDNVCQWMTSLRQEIHNYRSFGIAIDDDNIALCHPKSIPAKNTLIYCSSGSGGVHIASAAAAAAAYSKLLVSNCQNTIDKSHSTSPISSRISNVSSSNGSNDDVVTLRRQSSQQTHSAERHHRSPVDQMVDEFKRNLMAKQMQQVQQQQQQQQQQDIDAIANSMSHSETVSVAHQQRVKRQAIYLKMDADNNKNNEHNNNNNNNDDSDKISKTGINNSNGNDANAIVYSRKQMNNNEASQFADVVSQCAIAERGLNSRRAARKPFTSSSKRCGIYERDSEFVNDILSAFDTFLQRQSDDIDESQQQQQQQDQNQKRSNLTNICRVNETTDEETKCRRDRFQSRNVSTAALISVVLHESNPCASVNCVLDKQLAAVVFESGHQLHVQPFAAKLNTAEQIFDLNPLINNLLLSRSLNRIVIYFEEALYAFLHSIRDRVDQRLRYLNCPQDHLVRKFQRFHAYCRRELSTVNFAIESNITNNNGGDTNTVNESVLSNFITPKNGSRMIDGNRGDGDGDGDRIVHRTTKEEKRNCVQIVVRRVETTATTKTASEVNKNGEGGGNSKIAATVRTEENVDTDSVSSALEKVCDGSGGGGGGESAQNDCSETHNSNNKTHLRRRPQVPARDPKTILTNTVATNTMTVPSANSTPTHNANNKQRNDDDDIYQPIWKFKTVGEVQERYHTDADYFDVASVSSNAAAASTTAAAMAKKLFEDDSSVLPSILISNNVEDHSEWETDDEFMFSTPTENETATDACSLNSSTVRSTRSNNSSITGSTVTGFGSSTATLASAISASLTHHLFRNIGIFYSLTQPKLRAIVYDYDRAHCFAYFAKWPPRQMTNDDSGIGKSPKEERSPIPPPRTTSAAAAYKTIVGNTRPAAAATGESGSQSVKVATTNLQLLPDSVQAWKFMLLDINYIEDEEDMIVSESEILRAQEIKEDVDGHQTQQLTILQRFKSASIGNLIDLPNEDDKKSIAERMRNKLQRGVFKLNVRSPKSEKKSRGIFRRAEATSLYLEDGMKPKYPIFGAPLDQLELNQTTYPNVPCFVVDCVEYIERKECIQQDGLYRASGNKVCIDELKQKLSESYIYDPKLLITDDIHTLTSLLKLFFRELGAPLIPQETYERLGRNLTDAAGIETLRLAFEDMREPNRSTLKFLIKHLTNVAACSSENRMPASNLAIVWGPCIWSVNQIEFDIGRMNTLAKTLIENYERIFSENERLVS